MTRFTYSVLEVIGPVVVAALFVGAIWNLWQGFIAIQEWAQ